MVTVDNLEKLYPKINTKDLPTELSDNYGFIFENLNYYNNNTTLKECIDLYLSKLNECLIKENYTLNNGVLSKETTINQMQRANPNIHIVSVPKSQPKETTSGEKPTNEKQPKATTKKKTVKLKKPKYKEKQSLFWYDENDFDLCNGKIERIVYDENTGEPYYEVTDFNSYFSEIELIQLIKEKKMFLHTPAKLIEKLPPDVAYIKRYVAMHGKIKTGDQVLSLLHSLQKAITERTINKESEYCDEIEQIQNELIKCVETVNTSATIEIDAKRLEHYRSIVGQYEPMLSVVYLKRYISLNGKSGVKGKAQELARLIKKRRTLIKSSKQTLIPNN